MRVLSSLSHLALISSDQSEREKRIDSVKNPSPRKGETMIGAIGALATKWVLVGAASAAVAGGGAAVGLHVNTGGTDGTSAEALRPRALDEEGTRGLSA